MLSNTVANLVTPTQKPVDPLSSRRPGLGASGGGRVERPVRLEEQKRCEEKRPVVPEHS